MDTFPSWAVTPILALFNDFCYVLSTYLSTWWKFPVYAFVQNVLYKWITIYKYVLVVSIFLLSTVRTGTGMVYCMATVYYVFMKNGAQNHNRYLV